MFGSIPAGTCGDGLQCQAQDHMAFGRGVCVTVQAETTTSTPETNASAKRRKHFIHDYALDLYYNEKGPVVSRH